MGKYLDIARRFLEEKEELVLEKPADFAEIPTSEPELETDQRCLLNLLTEAEREAYQECVEFLMASDKHKMDRESAESEATRWIVRNKQVLQARDAAENYRRYGYVKIFSTVLNQAIYFAKDKQVAKIVPDQSLPVFTESDMAALKGLSREEAKVVMEGKIIFNGPIRIEE